jgi:ArsR family transcriptional regulator, arsenate/arsenite/antimonite-responsive transcriptional repressor
MVIAMKDISLNERSAHLLDGLAALANPARLQILEVLAEEPQSIVADIVRRLPLAQATVSQHLKVLQEAGLIHDERAGAGRCCRIDLARLFSLSEEFASWSHRLASVSLCRRTEGGERCQS